MSTADYKLIPAGSLKKDKELWPKEAHYMLTDLQYQEFIKTQETVSGWWVCIKVKEEHFHFIPISAFKK